MLHSIVVPFQNEVGRIGERFRRMRAAIDGLPREEFEVILVDDGSDDGTAEALDRIHAEDERFKVLHLASRFGPVAAVAAGLQWARGATISLMDPELPDPAEALPRFLDRWRAGAELVHGVPQAQPRAPRGSGRIGLLARLDRAAAGLEAPLDGEGLRLLDRRVVDAYLEPASHAHSWRRLRGALRLRQAAVPCAIAARPRGPGGTGPAPPRGGSSRLLLDALTALSFVPLRLFSWAGSAMIALALVALMAIFALRYLLLAPTPPWYGLAAILIGLSGVQLAALSVLGEYLGRMLDPPRKRPVFLVSRAVGFAPAPPVERPSARPLSAA